RGGFVAAKCTAYDPRIRALAVVSPGYDRRYQEWATPYDMSFLMHIFHVRSREALEVRLAEDDLTLEGQAGSIRCAALVIADNEESQNQFEGSRRLFNEIAGPREWLVLPGSQRNGLKIPYLVMPLTADFLAEQLRS